MNHVPSPPASASARPRLVHRGVRVLNDTPSRRRQIGKVSRGGWLFLFGAMLVVGSFIPFFCVPSVQSASHSPPNEIGRYLFLLWLLPVGCAFWIGAYVRWRNPVDLTPRIETTVLETADGWRVTTVTESQPGWDVSPNGLSGEYGGWKHNSTWVNMTTGEVRHRPLPYEWVDPSDRLKVIGEYILFGTFVGMGIAYTAVGIAVFTRDAFLGGLFAVTGTGLAILFIVLMLRRPLRYKGMR